MKVDKPYLIRSYFYKYKKDIIFLTISGLIYNSLMPKIFTLQGDLVDSISSLEYDEIVSKVIYFIMFTVFVMICRYFKRYYVRDFANKSSRSMRFMIYNSLLSNDYEHVSEDFTEVISKAVTDVDISVEGMRKVTTEVFDTFVLIIAYIVTLFQMDYKMTISAIVFIPVAYFISHLQQKRVVKYNKLMRSETDSILDLTSDQIKNNINYRNYNIEKYQKDNYLKSLKNLKTVSKKAKIIDTSMPSIYNIITMLGMGFVIYYGFSSVVNNTLSIGEFSAYVGIYTALSIKSAKSAKLFNSYTKAKVSFKRIEKYLIDYQEFDNPKNDEKEPRMELENVSFSYDKPIIKNANLILTKGIYGLSGSTAIGKSTFAKIMSGLVKTDDGKVITRGSLSYLGHKPMLFSSSIKNNILMGEDKEIDLSLVDLDYSIDTILENKGNNFSGGEQKRLALMRSLLSDSNIIILDDPFSSVDKKTEKDIVNNLKRYDDKIIIVVSHRVSSFKYFDKVILLNDDHTLSVDTHKNLLKNNQQYKELVQLQGGAVDETCMDIS